MIVLIKFDPLEAMKLSQENLKSLLILEFFLQNVTGLTNKIIP